MRRRLSAGLAVVAVAIAVLALAGPAAAHIEVDPSAEAKGSLAELSFRVPNEMDSGNTTQFELDLPTDHPFPSVAVKPLPGWTFAVTKFDLTTPLSTDDGQVTQAVSKIVWTGGRIAPGEFVDFDVSVALPHDVDRVVFKAIQTYDNGQVVRWIDPTVAGQPEPPHPAPVLTLTAASGNAAAAAPSGASTTSGTTKAASRSDVSTARTLGIIGLIAGLLGLLAGGAALALRRRPSPPTSSSSSS